MADLNALFGSESEDEEQAAPAQEEDEGQADAAEGAEPDPVAQANLVEQLFGSDDDDEEPPPPAQPSAQPYSDEEREG